MPPAATGPDAVAAGGIGMATEADSALPRLKTRAQFQSVLAHATCARTAHFALHVLPLDAAAGAGSPAAGAPDARAPHGAGPRPGPSAQGALFPGGGVWLGAMTPKRWARRAVTRNAIRRQIYAMVQDEGPPPAAAPDMAWVVRLRAEFSRKTYVSAVSEALKGAVRDELRALWARAAPR